MHGPQPVLLLLCLLWWCELLGIGLGQLFSHFLSFSIDSITVFREDELSNCAVVAGENTMMISQQSLFPATPLIFTHVSFDKQRLADFFSEITVNYGAGAQTSQIILSISVLIRSYDLSASAAAAIAAVDTQQRFKHICVAGIGERVAARI